MWNTLIFSVAAVIFGLIFGSFYNVVIFRVPKKISLINPKRSFCPVCKHQLAWKDNIPILSYIFLGGKCRYCGTKISPIYPVIEASTAMMFLISVFLTSNVWSMLSLWILFSGGIIITAIDLQSMMIPDFAVIMTAIGGGLWAISNNHIILSLLSAGIGFGVFLIIYLASRGGMGFGDVEYFGALALYLVPISIVWAILIASVSAICFALPMLLTKKANGKTRVPFGPFLVLGVSVAIFIPWR